MLHKHALAVHDGKDTAGALRSAVPLKLLMQVRMASEEESGGRPYSIALQSCIGRTWVFVCMSQADCDEWLKKLKAATLLTHGGALMRELDTAYE